MFARLFQAQRLSSDQMLAIQGNGVMVSFTHWLLLQGYMDHISVFMFTPCP